MNRPPARKWFRRFDSQNIGPGHTTFTHFLPIFQEIVPGADYARRIGREITPICLDIRMTLNPTTPPYETPPPIIPTEPRQWPLSATRITLVQAAWNSDLHTSVNPYVSLFGTEETNAFLQEALRDEFVILYDAFIPPPDIRPWVVQNQIVPATGIVDNTIFFTAPEAIHRVTLHEKDFAVPIVRYEDANLQPLSGEVFLLVHSWFTNMNMLAEMEIIFDN